MSTVGLADAYALFEKPMLHRAARDGQRRLEVPACHVEPAAAKLELAERRGVEGIGGEAIGVCDGPDLLDTPLGAIPLRDGDRAVERDDG